MSASVEPRCRPAKARQDPGARDQRRSLRFVSRGSKKKIDEFGFTPRERCWWTTGGKTINAVTGKTHQSGPLPPIACFFSPNACRISAVGGRLVKRTPCGKSSTGPTRPKKHRVLSEGSSRGQGDPLRGWLDRLDQMKGKRWRVTRLDGGERSKSGYRQRYGENREGLSRPGMHA